MHDSDQKIQAEKKMFHVNHEQAKILNPQGFGIFISVNDFKTTRRTINNLEKIISWAVDIDDAPKHEQLEKIKKGLVPSLIVESKRSLQVYWRAKRATFDCIERTKINWTNVMVDRLVPYYGADKNARDIARVLRMPGYFHMKNPDDPFMVEKIHSFNVSYTLDQMLMFYPDANFKKKEEKQKKDLYLANKTIITSGSNFFEKVYSLDCEMALHRLSGLPCVDNEIFSFRQNNIGTKQIYVNGKSTSSWIDVNGKIGSLSEGGPTIYQWLKWYNNPNEEIIRIIKERFPECR